MLNELTCQLDHAVLLRLLAEHDAATYAHSCAVRELVHQLAMEMQLDAATRMLASRAALLHDIGKLGIARRILQKPGRLTHSEHLAMRRHPVLSAEIVATLPTLRHLTPAVRHHHERWDGAGYPDKLAGERIPLPARLIAVADAYHVMTAGRAYQSCRAVSHALAELRRCAATQFDPTVVRAFCQMMQQTQGEMERAA